MAARFFVGLENNYGRYPDILYHNNAHGADVLHSTLLLLNTPVLQRTLTDVEVLAALVAAAGHDVGHPGLNNGFLTGTGSELAVLYNDLVRLAVTMVIAMRCSPRHYLQSVLENHHAATTFRIMGQEGCNILAGLDPETRQTIRWVLSNGYGRQRLLMAWHV